MCVPIDENIVGMWDKRLPFREAWKFGYRVRPYLENTSASDLVQRASDILRNMSTLTPEGKFGLVTEPALRAFWEQKFDELALEHYRRNSPLERNIDPNSIPFNRSALHLVRANSDLASYVKMTGIYCRFGREEFMRNLFERGELRLSPASSFRTIEGDIARQDDELVLTTIVTPYDFDLGTISPGFRSAVPRRGWYSIEHRKPSDHYLYCMTIGFDFRYFVDFGFAGTPARSCVVIKDQDEFDRRLRTAVRKELKGWAVFIQPARYVDPYFVHEVLPGARSENFLYKNFRFLYQKELRLVAVPPRGYAGPLNPVMIRLGSLEGLADLLTIRLASGGDSAAPTAGGS